LILRATSGLLFGLENVLVIYVGASLVLDTQLSTGMLLAFLAYKRQFTSRVSALVDKTFELRLLGLHGERLADVVLTPVEDRPTAGRLVANPATPLAPTLELRELRFRYAEHEPYVLDGLDLKVAAGESIAIVGASGSGKSTLLNIVLGTVTPTGGDVLIGGFPLAQVGHELLRRTVAGVVQNDCLFAGTVGENISFFDTHADQARIEECAQLAAIHADIAALPMAYNTLVGFMGSTLSAGQQQRILLARALYARPSILILDEATSHLDVERETAVCAALSKLAITRIIVAHRPQTAAAADRVVALHLGKLVSVAKRAA
jgi:ATP-binding cassette subfamily B protein RaxB